jgi:hypothetical protein
MPRAKSDIANMAIRIFLQDMGRAYDEERDLTPYNGKAHFPTVRAFFEERCCYCGIGFDQTAAHQDHLIPVNKTDLGLHAWGDIVPACQPIQTPSRPSRFAGGPGLAPRSAGPPPDTAR